ncbi:hypothetical protein BaRGS_00031050 [Batillaria attramentaria]|uniref:Uncharacterized protein n=1 Tax=Batillaria attramentaria TaxID=370345 RepID=A0ABD0JRD9_9CAEN
MSTDPGGRRCRLSRDTDTQVGGGSRHQGFVEHTMGEDFGSKPQPILSWLVGGNWRRGKTQNIVYKPTPLEMFPRTERKTGDMRLNEPRHEFQTEAHVRVTGHGKAVEVRNAASQGDADLTSDKSLKEQTSGNYMKRVLGYVTDVELF